MTLPISDGVVTLRSPRVGDEEVLVEGRDEEWRRWLGPGDDHPRPSACIVVGDEVVGWIDHATDQEWLGEGEVNVGYALFPAHRGRGYATRAVRLLVRHLASDPAVGTAMLAIDPRNAASLRVAARAGFIACGSHGEERLFRRAVR